MTMNEEIDAAIVSHVQWGLRLKEAIHSGDTKFAVEDVLRDDVCVFGKWLYGDTIPPPVKSLKEYQEIIAVHARFHKHAATLVMHVNDGNLEEVKTCLSENSDYTTTSLLLVLHLRLWQIYAGNFASL